MKFKDNDTFTESNNYFLLQINELYEIVLYDIIHCIGVDKSCINQNSIIEFAREAFNIGQETHNALYDVAKEKEVNILYYIKTIFL